MVSEKPLLGALPQFTSQKASQKELCQHALNGPNPEFFNNLFLTQLPEPLLVLGHIINNYAEINFQESKHTFKVCNGNKVLSRDTFCSTNTTKAYMKTKQVRAEYIGLQLALIDLETIAGQIEGFCIQTRNLHTNMYLYFTNENIHLKLTLLQ